MQYEKYIARCKAPKNEEKVMQIVEHILIGLRKGYATAYMANRLNQYRIYTLMGKAWTPHSLQMQILKMQRLDADSSLAWGLAQAIEEGDATADDLELLAARVRTLH